MTDAANMIAASDDWLTVRDGMLTNPRVRGAYDDAGNDARTTLTLSRTRKSAGMTRSQVAAWIADYTGMRPRRALRWVNRYEDGELGGNAPIWLIHAYARAVGVAVVLTVAAPEVAA